jgi:hypothetical protein
VKRFLKAFKNIGVPFNLKQFSASYLKKEIKKIIFAGQAIN